MRRYTFYLSVALFAFGIGSLVVFNLYWKQEDKSRQFEINEEIQSQKIEFVNQINNPSRKLELTCKEKTIKLVWDKLKKDLGEDLNDLANESQKDCADYFTANKITDLNGDGKAEIIVNGEEYPFCASGGCWFWVFQKRGANEYKIIFNYFGSFEIKNTKTNDYRDIKLVFRYSSDEFGHTIFKFEGKKYVAKECWMEHLTEQDKNGKIIVLSKPKITPYKCK